MSKRGTALLLGLLVFVSLVSLCRSAEKESCPTWLYPSEEGWCTCGSSVRDVILCNNETQQVSIMKSFCLTSSERDANQAVVGSCLYTQHHGQPADGKGGLYLKVNQNLSKQDQQVCGYLNREGQICGKCRSNHYVSAYSYDFKCYKCQGGVFGNVIAYLSVAFLPLTLFLVAMVVFHVSVASPYLAMAIFLCQIYSLPESVRVFLINTRGSKSEIVVRFFATIYGIWNLDFFRTLVPPICLKLTTVQVIALDYLVAIYPLLLLVCFYKLVTAHDRGCRLVVRLWRPFLWCSARIRQQWNVKHSIIDAFATFIILSYMKFLNISFDLLMATKVVDGRGSKVGYFLYYDGTIEFMSLQHLPYAIVALAVLMVEILYPLIFILYPTKWFQNLLNKSHLNSPGLRIFMQCFQGHYRDRTDGERECRYFAAVYPMLRIGGAILYAVTHHRLYFATIIIVILFGIATIVMVQPYKDQFYNTLDALLLMSAAGFCASVLVHMLSIKWFVISPATIAEIVGTGCSLIPLLYFTALFMKRIKNSTWKRKEGILAWRNRRNYEDLSVRHPLLDPQLIN